MAEFYTTVSSTQLCMKHGHFKHNYITR